MLCLFLLVWLTAPVAFAEEASLSMRFVYDGVPPKPKRLVIPGVPLNIQDEKLLVDQQTKGIRNVVVQLYTGRGGSEVDVPPHEGVRQKSLVRNGRFDPHVLLTQKGDSLEIDNQGRFMHNVALNFFANTASIQLLKPGESFSLELEQPEPALIPIDCNINPWMRGFVVVVDHPYVAVSDSDGRLKIEGLPADEELVFRVHHEAGKIDQVSIGGREIRWPRARFSVLLDPGENDLGDILVSPESFWN
ncbi:hypothetical protein [Rhodopirellula bahusiensis]